MFKSIEIFVEKNALFPPRSSEQTLFLTYEP